MQPLKDIVIVDFTRLLPGPLATHLLQQMGATIIKVEHPKRKDVTRFQPPFIEGEATLFHLLNHQKNIQTIAYDTPEGKEKLAGWLRKADILIEQFRPGAMESWGLAYEQLKQKYPWLLYLSLTGYGQDGELAKVAGHDINYLAYSGLLSLNKDENGKPVIPGVQIADIAAGSFKVVQACLLALLQRQKDGKGQFIDIAMVDGLIPLMAIPFAQLWGGLHPATANFLSGGLVNYNVYQCSDKKWIALGALELKFWNKFCQLAGQPNWERKQVLELSIHVFPKAEVEAYFATDTRDAWAQKYAQEDVCLAPILEIEEIEDQNHIKTRGLFHSFETEKGNIMKTFRNHN